MQVENNLNFFRSALTRIQTKESSELSFNDIYYRVYDIVKSKGAVQLYNLIIEIIKNHLITNVLPLVTSKLTECEIDSFVKAWDDHQVVLECFRKLFFFLDKDVSNRFSLQKLQNTGIDIFNQEIFQPNREILRSLILNAITAERNGQGTCAVPIKSVIDFFLMTNSLTFYVEYFEEAFLTESIDFYKVKVEEHTRTDNTINYINYYEKCVLDEKTRVGKYLHESTEGKLLKILSDNFIKNNFDNLQQLVETDFYLIFNVDTPKYYHNLQVLLEWFTHCNYLQRFRDMISNIFREKGLSISEGKKYQDHAEVIENLLKLKQCFCSYEQHCFNDLQIRQNLISDFQHIFNQNSKIPEYLAAYIHKILNREKKLSEIELEEKISSFFELYKILVDKDVFENFYKINLERRLLCFEPSSAELENKVIARLKMECASITATLEEMIKDIEISNTHMEMFTNDLQVNEQPLGDFEFSITILKEGLWKMATCTPCILPPIFSSVFEIYHEFYSRQHNGRKLRLQSNLGHAQLIGHFPSSNRKKFTFTVSTIQMFILLLFNDHETLSLQEIHEFTDIPLQSLICALIPISLRPRKSCHKILNKDSGDTKSIEPSDKFSLNNNYNSPNRRIKLPFQRSTIEEVNTDAQSIWMKTEADRRFEIDAAIVRAMKARRVLTHVALVEEVIILLQRRFKPKVMTIDLRIFHLINKEYIAKDPKAEKTYIYLP